jgi:hypothetical protein
MYAVRGEEYVPIIERKRKERPYEHQDIDAGSTAESVRNVLSRYTGVETVGAYARKAISNINDEERKAICAYGAVYLLSCLANQIDADARGTTAIEDVMRVLEEEDAKASSCEMQLVNAFNRMAEMCGGLAVIADADNSNVHYYTPVAPEAGNPDEGHTHAFEEKVAATCVADGYKQCSCGATEVIPATGHAHGTDYVWIGNLKVYSCTHDGCDYKVVMPEGNLIG